MELEKKPMRTHLTLSSWCETNGYGTTTKECIMSAFGSNEPHIQELAKKEKLKGIPNGKR